MKIKEVKETITRFDGETFEFTQFEIEAKDGYILSKKGYNYGKSVITDDPNGWIEVEE